MKIKPFVTGTLQTNAYLIYDESKGVGVLIDPGSEDSEILFFLKERGVHLSKILLTHGHIDHILGLNYFYEEFTPEVYCHIDDKESLINPAYNLSDYVGRQFIFDYPMQEIETDGQLIELWDENTVEVLHTPGHTPGSVCYYLKNENVLFSGDTLFMGSVGRTDLPHGSPKQLRNSLEKLKRIIPPKTRIYSGHGLNTIFESELKNNPYLS